MEDQIKKTNRDLQFMQQIEGKQSLHSDQKSFS